MCSGDSVRKLDLMSAERVSRIENVSKRRRISWKISSSPFCASCARIAELCHSWKLIPVSLHPIGVVHKFT